jgi:hypothetical protein
VYAAKLDHDSWWYWRDAPPPDISQHFTGTFSADGNTITGVSYRVTRAHGRTIWA